VRAGGLGQREGLPDQRPDLPRRDVGQELTGEVGPFARPDLKVPEAGDRDLPPSGLAPVDRGEAPAGRPVGGEPAAVGDDPVGVEAELTADAVEHHNGASPSSCVKNRRRPARLPVVDDRVGPGCAHGIRLGCPPGGADDPRPPRSQQLDQEDAHPAGRAEHQDLLPGANVDQPGDAKGGRPVVDDRRGEQRIEPVGDRNDVVEPDRGPLGVSAAAARPAGVGDHRPPEPAGLNPVANRDHRPDDPAPGDVGRPDREEADAAPGSDHRVHEQHVARAGADHDLSSPGDGIRRRGRPEHVRAAEPVDRDDAHPLRRRSAGSRPPRRGASAGRAARDRRCRRGPAAGGCG
jgi:hypothetical protein